MNELKRDGIVLPKTVLVLQLLESVYLERKERQSVLTTVDYSQKETMYEQMRKASIKFQGDESGPQKGASMTFRVKEELVNTSENEEVLYSERSLGQTSCNNRGRMTQRGRTSTNWSRGKRSRGSGSTSKNVGRRSRFLNPKDVDGNILRCYICDSYIILQKAVQEVGKTLTKLMKKVKHGMFIFQWKINRRLCVKQLMLLYWIKHAQNWASLKRYILRIPFK